MGRKNIKPEDEQIDEMNEKRAKEFLECMGNGKPIHQCEEDNNFLDEEEAEMTTEQKEIIAGESKYNLCGGI